MLLHCGVATSRGKRREKTLTITKEPETKPTPPARITTPEADTASRKHPIKFPIPAAQSTMPPNHMNCRGEFPDTINKSILGRARRGPREKIPNIAPKKMGRSEDIISGIAASQNKRSNPETESSNTAEMQDATSTVLRIRMLIQRIIFCTTSSSSTARSEGERRTQG